MFMCAKGRARVKRKKLDQKKGGIELSKSDFASTREYLKRDFYIKEEEFLKKKSYSFFWGRSYIKKYFLK